MTNTEQQLNALMEMEQKLHTQIQVEQSRTKRIELYNQLIKVLTNLETILESMLRQQPLAEFCQRLIRK